MLISSRPGNGYNEANIFFRRERLAPDRRLPISLRGHLRERRPYGTIWYHIMYGDVTRCGSIHGTIDDTICGTIRDAINGTMYGMAPYMFHMGHHIWYHGMVWHPKCLNRFMA